MYTWLSCNCSEKYSYIETENTVKHLEMICQYSKLCFILLGNPVMHCGSNGSQWTTRAFFFFPNDNKATRHLWYPKQRQENRHVSLLTVPKKSMLVKMIYIFVLMFLLLALILLWLLSRYIQWHDESAILKGQNDSKGKCWWKSQAKMSWCHLEMNERYELTDMTIWC